MPTIKFDGQEVAFEQPEEGPKKNILQVALENNIEIPHYCYHPGLSIVASCRICLAEVGSPNPKNDDKVEIIPKLLPTCQTPATDGMEVHLKSPKAIANQKAVMEFLLINHPLDCPVCDQAGECYLQDYSYQYGRAKSRFMEAKLKQPKKDLGSTVMLYADRCIMCSRCVRFTREVSGTSEIGVFGRGSQEQIDVFPGRPLENELSGNVVDLCPVGALLDKDFLMSMRVWNLRKTPSIDGITASGDNISIEHNEDKVYRLKPRTNMDVNRWWISDEIRYGWKFIHREDRLRSATIKRHGAHEECDWNVAYHEAEHKLTGVKSEKGEGSLAVMVSPMLSCEEAYLLGKLAIALDPGATLAVGPIPRQGEDKTFPGGYTIHAEKCPNARGVRRALGQLTDEALDYDQLLDKLKGAADGGEGGIGALVLTGNYPSDWTTPELLEAMRGRYTVLLDTLPSDLTEEADLVLPGATWAEKAGTFENVNNRLQSFDQAIPVIELAKPEGQIALDMLGKIGAGEPTRFDAERLRREMGDAFAGDVQSPPQSTRHLSDIEYVKL